MSLTSKRNDVNRVQKELNDLDKKLFDESKKETSKQSDIFKIEQSISKTTSESTLRMKQKQIIRYKNDLVSIQKKKADYSKKITDKRTLFHKFQGALSKEEENDRKKINDAEKKREKEQLEHQQKVTRELQLQKILKQDVIQTTNYLQFDEKKYDAFISHAFEDKKDFVRPLAEALIHAGYKIWYDNFTLKVGDSLRQSIDKGLVQSRYGIVVLSSAFFSKKWTNYELDGLVTKEMGGYKVILPIWHKVSKDEVESYSPSLADKVAINSSLSGIDVIVEELGEVLKR